MREIDVLMEALNKRAWQKARYDASLHNKEINVPISHEDEPELDKTHEKILDDALKRAMDRKRDEMHGRR